jgi:hypothetical protein
LHFAGWDSEHAMLEREEKFILALVSTGMGAL